jgi:hypothetical protein
MPVMPALGWLRQEEHEFQASLGKVGETLPQKIKAKGPGHGSSGKSACLAFSRPWVQAPALQQKTKHHTFEDNCFMGTECIPEQKNNCNYC